MLSQTRRALEDFDNQHDFERMAADILNGLGYQGVEPMAPGGGPDRGQDIRFREGDATGVALVTLEKRIRDKFKRDLAKQPDSEGTLALFCNVDVSPSLRLEFAREANAKGYVLEVFDLERLRSLLDSSLKDVRRRYLSIDDEVADRLRSEVRRLLRFPDAIADNSPPPTKLERLLVDTLPRKLFDLLMQYDEQDVMEVPGIGPALHEHLTSYYAFRRQALDIEGMLMETIGGLVGVRFSQAWRILLQYVVMRFAGTTREQIEAGPNFLNYGITWEEAEKTFQQLSDTNSISGQVSELLSTVARLSESARSLSTDASLRPAAG